MNNTWKGPSSVKNYCMILVLMEFYTILGCVVFNLIPTPCNYHDIWDIIIIKRIKCRFMIVTINILNTSLDTLETRKIRCHILGSRPQYIQQITILLVISMFFIHRIVCPNLVWYSISSLPGSFLVKVSSSMSSFLYL